MLHSAKFGKLGLSGRIPARSIPRWREQGYCVELYYLRLSSPDMAVARVRRRIAEGGHRVPEAVVRRRYHAGWSNFGSVYRHMADRWAIYDNFGFVPIPLEKGGNR